jgi:hypothetical protein
MPFTVSTSSAAPSEMDVAAATGRLHAEHVAGILANTPADRRDALREGARIRLGSFIVANVPCDGPIQQILDSAFRAFDLVLNNANKENIQ